MPDARVCCAGWAYDAWRGAFYPPQVKLKDRLAYYATVFDTTEINGSFYRLSSKKAVQAWAKQVQNHFVFAWKVSRYITHNKKLKGCQDSVALAFGRMAPLGRKAGPALVQLPPMLHRDDERLNRFLSWLPAGRAVSFEFRHPSWYEPAVLDILRDHGRSLGARPGGRERPRPRLNRAGPMSPPVTPDGRYFVVWGWLWRCSLPDLAPERRQALVDALMAARRAVRAALASDDRAVLAHARAGVQTAKVALGERGPVWWSDDAPDLNRHMSRNTLYTAWFASLGAPGQMRGRA